ncbi:lecithin retinol acyltransferase family protein [Bdellovibrio sp. HCB-162]|uniref:lecithin retinol acyltransferase family protein n=1 Tax=Bdellovibrio sp. HCB-162 TaxID=3394234 RepID=UPI0039BD763E
MSAEKFKDLTINHCALIYRPLLDSPIGRHYGFLAVIQGRWQVIHLSKFKKPEMISLEVFAARQECDIEEMRILEKAITAERIRKALKEYSTYNLLTNNCEDFARFIYNGKWRSEQTISMIVLGFFALLVATA